MNFLKKLFLKKEIEDNFTEPNKWTDEESDEFYLEKEKAIERIMGKSANVVGHAIISFFAGGKC